MNCSRCGNSLPESGSSFCPFCRNPQENSNGAADSANSGSFSTTPAAGGTFPATPAGQVVNPFDATQQPQKKGLPGWAIALIAGGIVFALAICGCIFWVVMSDEFQEGFQEGLNAGQSGSTITTPTSESAALIQDFINTNRSSLTSRIQDFVIDLGVSGGVEFEAADGELFFIYTYCPSLYDYDGLGEALEEELFGTDWTSFYTGEANRLANEIGLDELTITVIFYYGDDQSYLASRSFHSW